MAAADKKNRPDGSQFRQQRMPAWQPVMSPPHIAVFLLVLAVAFIPVGIAIIVSNNNARDIEIRYDHIKGCTANHNDGVFTYNVPNSPDNFTAGCNTVVNFTVESDIAGPVYLYYKLTNFYQNHRRFAKSRDVAQLAGVDQTLDAMSDCDPMQSPGQIDGTSGTALEVDGMNMTYGAMAYSPCGLVAWSMFNDTFRLGRVNAATGDVDLVCDSALFSRVTSESLVNQSCRKSGITWESDYEKFKLPLVGAGIWTGNRSELGLDPVATANGYLSSGWYANEPGHAVPLTTDEDLMVWMRTASLPTFRKLLRVIDGGLPAGNYVMQVTELYDATQYDGTKSFALSTVSWIGGKNTFLGVAYVVVGVIAFVAAVVFFVVYKINGDRTEAAVSILNSLR